MIRFQIRQFISVPYFIQLMVISTLTALIVQWLAWQAWGAVRPADAWTRAGMIGLWTTCTAAAGIIGFERFKGTLVHLVISPVGALRSCGCVVISAATFGLAAFVIAWSAWAVLTWSFDFDFFTFARFGEVALGVITFWIGAVAMCLLIAAIFVLTPNAITYEGLLAAPIFLFSGLMFTDSPAPFWISIISKFLPLSLPIDSLFSRPDALSWINLGQWLVCVCTWFVLAALAGRAALRKATEKGTLEVL
ncbi:ABC transporter permease [Arcanobacterium hippocoleae]